MDINGDRFGLSRQLPPAFLPGSMRPVSYLKEFVMTPGLRFIVHGLFFVLCGSICFVTVKAEETRPLASDVDAGQAW